MSKRALPKDGTASLDGFEVQNVENRRHYTPKRIAEASSSTPDEISLISLQALGSMTGIWVGLTEKTFPEHKVDISSEVPVTDERGDI